MTEKEYRELLALVGTCAKTYVPLNVGELLENAKAGELKRFAAAEDHDYGHHKAA